jgi:hypothetical protein
VTAQAAAVGALVAAPADYAVTGVMAFIVSHDGGVPHGALA